MVYNFIFFLFFLVSGFADSKPNIVIIMTDDMGFSDIGCYGAEIETPNLDQLAKNGLRFTQFYNTGKCCPTRASLLTGLYSHQAGMGGMTRDEGEGRPGYRGRIMPRAVTFAEVLSPAGYLTIQTGKWHVGDKKKEWWPLGRGFDRCFGSPAGGGFYYRPSAFRLPRTIIRGDEVLYDQKNDHPKGFYTTDAYTDEGLKYVREAVDQKKPFMWYLAYNAPHFPLKAKPEDIAKYRGKYKEGWDVIRNRRLKKLIDLGIFEESLQLTPRDTKVPKWNSLSESQKDFQDLCMATYAAMIDSVDQNIGKLVTELKSLGVYENTLILFLCDNGGCAEGSTLASNKGKGEVGTAESFAYYGKAWANVSNTPFRLYKNYVHEGGISTPLVAHWPKGISEEVSGSLVKAPTHLIDIMTTVVDISGASYPKEFEGNEIIPMQGKSLNAIFKGKKFDRKRPLFFEFAGNKAIRYGKWKLISLKKGKWELYDIEKDRSELNDLSQKFPEVVQELEARYATWAENSFVIKK